jgi:tetratricopeptide (TPR) repeat protein
MYQYGFAISFADEDRNYAEKLAKNLTKKYKFRVFYDYYQQANLVGEYLTEYLIDIYKNKARYCIVIVSKNYEKKRYTRHEWRAAQERAFNEPDVKYLIVIRLDDTKLPGLLDTLGYFDSKKWTLSKISDMIYSMSNDEISKLNIIWKAQEHYNKGEIEEAHKLVEGSEFDDNIDALWIRESTVKTLGSEKDRIRILNKILKLRKGDGMAHFIIALCYYRENNFKKSVSHFEEAIKVYPKHPTILETLPLAKMKLKRKSKILKGKRRKIQTRKHPIKKS